MEKDNFKTDIVFRKFKDGQIIALMPHEVDTNKGLVCTYMHVGQHSSGDYNYVVSITKLATEDEFADLKKELESIGYDIKVIKKQNTDKYLKSLRNLLKSFSLFF